MMRPLAISELLVESFEEAADILGVFIAGVVPRSAAMVVGTMVALLLTLGVVTAYRMTQEVGNYYVLSRRQRSDLDASINHAEKVRYLRDGPPNEVSPNGIGWPAYACAQEIRMRLQDIESAADRAAAFRIAANWIAREVRDGALKDMRKCDQTDTVRWAVELAAVPTDSDIARSRFRRSWAVWWRKSPLAQRFL